MENTLIEAGLSRLQAQVYLYMLDNGSVYPTILTRNLSITRTNAYKVLESLEKLELVKRRTQNKKVIYYPENPIALASLIAEKRNDVIALEQSIDKAMRGLQNKYRKQKTDVRTEVLVGKESIIESYNKQAQQKQPIYFVKSRADIPFMGFEVMRKVRVTQGMLSNDRYGITTDSIEASKNKTIDKRTHLTRTWINEHDYTAPVEWSVSGDTLVIQVFEDEGKSIVIRSDLIAKSFIQLWQITDKALRSSVDYKKHPIKASREV
jgi:predicted transcriptional regulator